MTTTLSPSESYSITMRLEIQNKVGMLGKVTTAIGDGGRRHRGGRPLRPREGNGHPGRHRAGARDRARAEDHQHRQGAPGGQGRQRLRPDLPDAPGREDRGPQQDPGQDPERPVHGVHPGRRARLHGDPQGREEVVLPDDPAELRGRRLGRHGGAGAGGHRPRGGDAGHGREGDAVQGVRRDRRLADLPQHEGHRGDRPDRQGARADLRGDQPRGHLRAALLRDRGAPEGRDGDPGLPRRPARDGGGRAGRRC